MESLTWAYSVIQREMEIKTPKNVMGHWIIDLSITIKCW
jgi:hypothetical protein